MPVDYNVIWDQVSPGWVAFVRGPEATQLRDGVLKPVIEELLGPVSGKRVLDAGCGEGEMCRWLAGLGAKVTGADISNAMLEAARAQEEQTKLGITYQQCSIVDLGTLGEFDMVVSNQVLSVVPDHAEAFQSIYKALKTGGQAVVTITHPMFDGVGPGWVEHAPEDTRWWANRYMARVDGVGAHGAPTYHRSFSDYISAAIEAGFVLTGFREPVASEEYSRKQPPQTWSHDRIPTLAALRLRKDRTAPGPKSAA